MTDTPAAAPASFSAHLQVVPLPGDAYLLVFDQWEGPRPGQGVLDGIKQQTGARGVIAVDGTIYIDC